MAEERRQNIFITLATDGLALRKHSFDTVVSYPISDGCVEMKDGFAPSEVKVELGRNALSLDECEKCIDSLVSNFKSIGCKLTNDIDMQYCKMSIDGGSDEMIGEFVLSFVVK